MINNIQALRALAAISVSIYHTQYNLFGTNTDFYGVAVFFVISGFIMCHISMRDGSENDPKIFIVHRIVRIVPLYWFCIFLFIGFSNLGLLNILRTLPHIFNQSIENPLYLLGWMSQIVSFNYYSLSEIFKSLFFIPYINRHGDIHPLLGVGWTLNMEMAFYLIFAFCLGVFKSKAPWYSALMILIIWFICGNKLFHDSPVRLYSNTYMIHFVIGILVYMIYKKIKTIEFLYYKTILSAFFGILFIGFFIIQLYPSPPLIYSIPYIFLIAPGILVLSSLFLEVIGVRIQNKTVLLLGAASYSIYLTHTIVLEFLRPIGDIYPFLAFRSTLSGFLVSLFLMIFVGLLVHFFVEKPMLNYLRCKIKNRSSILIST